LIDGLLPLDRFHYDLRFIIASADFSLSFHFFSEMIFITAIPPYSSVQFFGSIILSPFSLSGDSIASSDRLARLLRDSRRTTRRA
jgi:hypothetical protein